MSAYAATSGAIALSGATVIFCLGSLLSVYNEMQNIWGELDLEMNQFRAQADGLWEDLLVMGAGSPSNRKRRAAIERTASNSDTAQTNRNRRNGYSVAAAVPAPTCKCEMNNPCPHGAAGPPGDNGPPGVPGIPGKDGVPGVEALDWHGGPLKGCFNCPAGPQGSPGEAGRPGVRGMRGQKGSPGMPGRDGVPGLPGIQGEEGEQGADGLPGKGGEHGQDAEKPIGRRGSKGPPGEHGIEGPVGSPGNPGPIGKQGPPGQTGPPGFGGPPGSEGEEGGVGSTGKVGRDAAYCPCPGRDGHKSRGGGAVAAAAHEYGGAHKGAGDSDREYGGAKSGGAYRRRVH